MNEYEAILQAYLSGDQTALLALRDYALDEGMDDHAQMWETAIEGRERIDSLTPAEEELLDKVADYWLTKVGLKTGPTDRNRCEKLVDAVYRTGGLEPPGEKIWSASPMEMVGQMKQEVGNKVRDRVTDKVKNKVTDKVWDKVTDKVKNKVTDKVWDKVTDKVWSKVWSKVRGKVRDKVWDDLGHGTHDAHWLAYYQFFDLLGLKGLEEIRPLITFSQYCGWWAPYRGVVYLSDLPVSITESQIVYADGFSVDL